jgi:hypothetical protein
MVHELIFRPDSRRVKLILIGESLSKKSEFGVRAGF